MGELDVLIASRSSGLPFRSAAPGGPTKSQKRYAAALVRSVLRDGGGLGRGRRPLKRKVRYTKL